jgi:O-antigen ligase
MPLYLDKIQHWLLIIFLFTLPWQTRLIFFPGLIGGEYWEYGTICLYASDILLLIIIFLQFVKPHSEKVEFNISLSDFIMFIIATFVMLANIYLSRNHELSLFHASWIIMGLGLFFILRQEIISRSRALLSLISGAAMVCLLGTWQFLTQNTFGFSWLGLAKHSPGDLGSSVIEIVAPDGVFERWLRAYGSLDHPNMLGGLAALTIFFCLYLLFREQAKSTKEVTIIGAFIFLITGLYSSFSRSGLLALGLAIIIYFIFALRINFKEVMKKAAPLFIIGIIVTILFAIPFYYLLFSRLSLSTRLEQMSITERVAGYKDSALIIKENPIIGSGLGSYGLALEEAIPQQLVWFYQPIHNIFVLLLAEMGLLGLILLLLFIGKKTMDAWKKYPEDHLIITGTIAILLCLGLLDHWLMSLHFGVMLSAVALGLALKK